MNGPVFCAAVIQRTAWSSPASLIGHPDIVQAAAYNPLIFLRDPSKPPDMSNVCSLLALCAQGTVSLWFTDTSQPFVVVADLFDRDALDLSWSKDGKQLWASSSDGQVAVLTFDYAEFAPVAPEGTKAALHAAYGYTPSRAKLAAAPAVVANGFAADATPGGQAGGTLAQPNTLVARKGPGAKRPRTVQLVTQPLPGQQQQPVASTSAAAFASAPTLPGAAAATAFQQQAAQPPVPQQMFGAQPPPAASTASTSRKRKASAVPGEGGPAAPPPPGAYPYPYPYPADAPPPQFPGYGSAPRLSSAPYRLAGHTLRGDPAPPDDELRELVPAYALYDREVTFRVTNRRRAEGAGRKRLAVPQVVTFGKVALEDSDAKDTLEWRNFGAGERESGLVSFSESFSPSSGESS